MAKRHSLDLNLQLCRAIGVHDEVYFRPRNEKSVTRVWLPDWMRPIETAHALVTVPDPILGRDFVSGLLIPNPLRDSRWHDKRQRGGTDPNLFDSLYGLEELEFLICSLSDFHLAHDGRTYAYTLESVETARTSEGRLVRPVARWQYADEYDNEPRRDTAPSVGPQ